MFDKLGRRFKTAFLIKQEIFCTNLVWTLIPNCFKMKLCALYFKNATILSSVLFRSLSKSIDSPIFSLVHLELSDNHLHVIHAYVLSGFPNLKSLNLSGNGLHTVSVSAFGLPALETLDLSHNSMPTIGRTRLMTNSGVLSQKKS